jgi:hypothetical protein
MRNMRAIAARPQLVFTMVLQVDDPDGLQSALRV